MAYQNLIFTREGAKGTILMNRPSALNALNSATFHELNDVLDEIEHDDELRVIIVTGEGKAFVAGADIAEMKDMKGPEAKAFSELGQAVFRRMEKMDIIFIAAVNGYALGGGCEFAMGCDLRIASEKARFGQPEVDLGVTPGFAGTQRLPRLIGVPRAKMMLLTGEMIDAETAEQFGLVNRVVPPESLMEEAVRLADTIINKGPMSVKRVKSCIDRGMQTDIDAGSAVEAAAFGECFDSGETGEGMTAFLEKRKPGF